MSLYLLVLWPLFGAAAVYWISGLKGIEKRTDTVCSTFALICTGTEVLLVSFLMTEDMTVTLPRFGGFGLGLRFGSFTALLCLITSLLWLMTAVLLRSYNFERSNRVHFLCCFLIMLGSVTGVFLAADFFTLFMFLVLTILSVYTMIALDEKPQSLKKAGTFLLVTGLGSVFIIIGMLVLYKQIGSLSFDTVFTFSAYTNRNLLLLAGIFMLAGFGIIAAMVPLHIWLPSIIDLMPASVGALISGLMTQCGLYGILTVTVDMLKGCGSWTYILMWMGFLTAISGALSAVLSSNLKRILSFLSVSQTGFILLGMSSFNATSSVSASSGIILHMLNHALISFNLFACAGIIESNTHSLQWDDILGFGQGKPLLNAAFLSGAMGLGGIPLWNGYISKALLNESFIQFGTSLPDILFMLSSGLTITCLIKVYSQLFVLKRNVFSQPKREYTDSLSSMTLLLTGTLLPLIGTLPNTLARGIVNFSIKRLRADFLEPIYFFSGEILIRAFIAFIIGFALYFLLFKRNDAKEVIRKVQPQMQLLQMIRGRFIVQPIQVLLHALTHRDNKKKVFIPNISLKKASSVLLIFYSFLCLAMIVLVVFGLIKGEFNEKEFWFL